MGILDRVGAIAGGLAGAVKGVAMIPVDLATSLWNDDEEFNGFTNVLFGRTVLRGGEAMTDLFSAESGIGAAIGGLPEGARAPFRPVVEGLETAGREFIREPIATAIIAGSLLDSDEYRRRGGASGVGGFFNADVWQKAHELAQTTSPGQAFAAAIGTKDILDPVEMAQAAGTDWFNLVSGTSDAFLRLFVDVDVLAAKGFMGVRRSHIDRVLETRKLKDGSVVSLAPRRFLDHPLFERHARDILAIVEDSRVRATDDLAAHALAADRLSKMRPLRELGDEGSVIAQVLATAENADEVRNAYRAFLGDSSALNKMRPGLQNRFRQLMYDRLIVQRHRTAKARHDARFDALNSVAEDVVLEAEDLATKFLTKIDDLGLAAPLAGQVAPGSGLISAVTRGRSTRFKLADSYRMGDIIQGGFLSRPLRVITDKATTMLPHRLVNIHDSNAREQLARYLHNEKVDPALSVRLQQEFDQATDAATRFEIFLRAENSAVRTLLDEFDVTPAMRDRVLADAAGAQRRLQKVTSRRFAGARNAEGRNVDVMVMDVGDELVAMPTPLFETQTASLFALNRLDGVRKVLKRYEKRGWLDTLKTAESESLARRMVNDLDMDAESRKALIEALGEKAPEVLGDTGLKGRGYFVRRAADDNLELARHVLQGVNHYWKAGVLLRPAWAFRVVLMDEQLRMIMKFGTMARLSELPMDMRNLAVNFADEFGIVTKANRKRAAEAGTLPDANLLRPGMAGAAVGGLLGGPLGAGVGAGLGVGLTQALRRIDSGGMLNLVNDAPELVRLSDFDVEDVTTQVIGANVNLREIVPAEEAKFLNAFATDPGKWITRQGTDPDYAQAWGRAVNQQVGQSRLGVKLAQEHVRQLARGIDPTDERFSRLVVTQTSRWLTGSEEGRKVLDRMPILRRFRDEPDVIRERVAAAYGSVTDSTAAHVTDKIIRDIAEGRRADFRDLEARFPNPDDRPLIHGEAIDQALGESMVLGRVEKFIGTWFRRFGQLPTDTMARSPFFRMAFRRNLEARMDALRAAGTDVSRLTEKQLASIQSHAVKKATMETRDVLYDLAERSEFDEMVHLVMPFFPAWREVITRWAGLVYENPATATRMWDIFNAPDRAGLVYTDDRGDQHLTFRIPEWAKGLVNASPLLRSAVDSQGFIRMPKEGFNMVLQGGPGFGPFVQVPFAEVAKAQPEAAEALEFLFPYGAPENVVDAFLPAAGRRAVSVLRGEDDEAMASTIGRILITKLVQMENGEIERVDLDDPLARADFIQSVQKEASSLTMLRMGASLLSPAPMIFDSPYREHIDIYRRMRNEDPTTADDRFIDQFGSEFFALTQSMSRVNNGVPATVDGFIAQEKYQDLLTQFPEMGRLIIGSEGGGSAVEFSRAMYDRQLGTPLTPGSATKERERLAPEELLEAPDVRLGWTKFSRAMDMIEAARIERGLPNLSVKAAEPLAAMKRSVIDQLAAEHPSWYRQYSQTDNTKWVSRMQAFSAIAQDDRLRGRDDIRGLAEYLQGRAQITQALAARPFTTLSASANRDLSLLWETFVSQLKARNLAFADLHSRWLDNDPVSAEVAA